jgi:hypothetical protein
LGNLLTLIRLGCIGSLLITPLADVFDADGCCSAPLSPTRFSRARDNVCKLPNGKEVRNGGLPRDRRLSK